MATYAIGDIQGCFAEFQHLLDVCRFDPDNDRLWLVGDLVNRGPQSLAVLRAVHALRERTVCVLGNHDLHLLACAFSRRYSARSKDTFQDVLAADDREELLDWIRYWPLLHQDDALGYTLVHAGLPPAWDLATARAQTTEAEAWLRSPDFVTLLDAMYTDRPARWSAGRGRLARCRYTVNAVTRIRYCHADGRLDFNEKSALGSDVANLIPWFDMPGRENASLRIVFGHWSTMRLSEAEAAARRIVPLDTGCVWGGSLTAVRLEDGARFAVASETRIPLR